MCLPVFKQRAMHWHAVTTIHRPSGNPPSPTSTRQLKSHLCVSQSVSSVPCSDHNPPSDNPTSPASPLTKIELAFSAPPIGYKQGTRKPRKKESRDRKTTKKGFLKVQDMSDWDAVVIVYGIEVAHLQICLDKPARLSICKTEPK